MGNDDEAIRVRTVAGWMSTPRFSATLTRDFWLGTYEATAGCYLECTRVGACPEFAETLEFAGIRVDPEYYQQPENQHRPMVGLTWTEADAVCRWLGGRLPTEAERERAARGHDDREVPWGGPAPAFTSLCPWANSPPGRCSETGEVFTPVGSFPDGTGPYGHFDLVGNASELVADGEWLYDGGPRIDPMGPVDAARVMYRDGSRVAAWERASSSRDYRSIYAGTRCAWDEDPASRRSAP